MACSRNILLGLPPELLELVADHLTTGHDLLSLRLVSKEVAARCEKVMLETHFSNLGIIFSVRESFCKALNVAQHPKLRQAVRTITIYHGQLSRSVLDEQQFPSVTALPKEDRVAMKKHRQKRRRYFDLVEDEDQMREDHDDLFYMHQVFSCLASVTQDLTLRLVDLRHDNLAALLRGAGPSTSATNDANDDYFTAIKFERLYPGVAFEERYLRSLTSVLRETKYIRHQLTSLSAGDQQFMIPVEVFDPASHGKNTWADLTNITSLTLVLFRYLHYEGYQSQGASNGFVNFLQSLSLRLKRLDLRHGTGPCPNRLPREGEYRIDLTFERACTSVTFPKLEHLKLARVEARYEPLMGFSLSVAQTTKDVHLEKVAVLGCGRERSREEWELQFDNDLRSRGFPAGIGKLNLSFEWWQPVEINA